MVRQIAPLFFTMDIPATLAYYGSPRQSDSAPVIQAAFATRRTARNRRWSPPPAWPAEEMPFQLDYSAEHGQRLDEGIGVPRLRVYQHEIDEVRKHVTLWIRRKRGNGILRCPGCGRRVQEIHQMIERTVRDLPCFEYTTTVIVELYRLRCPDCGLKTEQMPQLPTRPGYRTATRQSALYQAVRRFRGVGM